MLLGELHFKIALNTLFCQKWLDFTGWKIDDTTVISFGSDGFGAALIDGEVLFVTDIEMETENVIHKKRRRLWVAGVEGSDQCILCKAAMRSSKGG